MNEPVFISLANNAAMLIALALVFDMIVLKAGFDKPVRKVLTGLVFGVLGVVVMLNPWQLTPGIFFDARSIVLAVGGLFFGTLPTLTAMLIASAFRFFSGGDGTLAGIAIIVSSGALGLLWRHQRRRILETITGRELLLFGIVVHIAMLLCTLLLPDENVREALVTISLPVMILFPPATLLLGKLMIGRLQRKKEADAVRASENELKRRNRFIETIIDHLPIGLAVNYIEEGETAYMNTRFQQIYGWPRAELTNIANFFRRVYPDPEYREAIQRRIETDIESGDPERMIWEDIEITTQKGEKRVVSAKNIPIPEQNLMISTVQDVTAQTRLEKELKESELRFRTLIEKAPVSISLLKNGAYIYSNQACANLLGYETPEDVIGVKTLDRIHPDCHPTIAERIKRLAPGVVNPTVRLKMRKANGDEAWSLSTSFSVMLDGEPTTIITAQDITDMIHAEQQIKASLAEKETLLQEIHHRVKNNMQVVSSLLKLQADRMKDDNPAREVILESQNRIHAISTVHETLHSSDRLSEIDPKHYISTIAGSVLQSYQLTPEKIGVKEEIELEALSVNQAYPLGLIINETLSNALKYAFPGDQQGTVTISIRDINGQAELIIADNGIGLPADLDWRNPGTLGLKLVRTLAENQLEGSIDVDHSAGSRFTIRFPLEK